VAFYPYSHSEPCRILRGRYTLLLIYISTEIDIWNGRLDSPSNEADGKQKALRVAWEDFGSCREVARNSYHGQ
jgi:hypothetical protein